MRKLILFLLMGFFFISLASAIIWQSPNYYIELSSEGNLNVNSSNYWDNLDTPLASWLDTFNASYNAKVTDNETWNESLADTLYAGIQWGYNQTTGAITYADANFIILADEGNLNVNSSNFWDNLGTPSDISTGDLTDDNTYVTVAGDTMTGNLILDKNLTIGSTVLFVDSDNAFIGIGTVNSNTNNQISILMTATKDILIDGSTNPRMLDTGVMRFEHQPAIDNTRAITVNIDNNNQENTHAIVVNFDTDRMDNLATIYDANIDISGGIAGIVRIYEASMSGSSSVIVHGYHVDPGVHPLTQFSGTFGNIEAAWDENGGFSNVTANFSSTTSNVTMFSADNDKIYIGMDIPFDSLSVTLNIVASGAGIKPVFELSTGVGTWGTNIPDDNTLGFRQSGLIAIMDQTGWSSEAVNGITKYWFRITRTANSLSTSPEESLIQVAATTTYSWDDNGALIVSSVNASEFFQNNLAVLDTGDETNLNVNSSNFWDNLNAPLAVWIATYNATYDSLIQWGYNQTTGAITYADNTFITLANEGSLNVNSATNWDSETSQADLNTNSSNFWDLFNTQTDLTALGTIGSATSITSSAFVGPLTGNADTVTVSDAGGDTTTWLLMSVDQTGSEAPRSDAELTYDASSNALTSSSFIGSLTGNSDTVTIADAGGDTTTFPLLGTAATGSLAPATDSGLTYQATTNALTATTFIGALTGNAATATSWDGETSQDNLNVNSADLWDALGSPTDILSLGTIGSATSITSTTFTDGTATLNAGSLTGIGVFTVTAAIDIGNFAFRALSGTFDSLTSGRIPFASTAGLLIDDADFTFSTDTLTITKIAAFILTGKLTAGAVEIEGSNFDINGGTVDGISSLTASGNLDIGAHQFKALILESDQATGTAPLTVASTTVVANLNADTVDAKSASDFLLVDGSDVMIGNLDMGYFNLTNINYTHFQGGGFIYDNGTSLILGHS